jgi:hypothetical protein
VIGISLVDVFLVGVQNNLGNGTDFVSFDEFLIGFVNVNLDDLNTGKN